MKRNLWCFVLLVALFFAVSPIMAQQTTAGFTESAAEEGSDDDDSADNKVAEADLTVDSNAADSDVEAVAKTAAKPGVAGDNDLLARFKKSRAEIQKLIKQRFFAKAEKQLSALNKSLKISKIDEKAKKQFMASLERRETVTLFSAQGQYQKAANAVRQAISLNELKGDTERLLKVQEKVGLQKEWFEIRSKHEKELRDLLENKQPLLKEKLAIVKQMDSKRKLSDEELKKLQGALKDVNARLAKVSKVLQETRRVFAVKREKMQKAGVILSAEQQRKLFPLVMKRMMVRFENYNLHKQIVRHLTNISEDSEVSWDGLKKNFAALAKLQEDIWSLRKQLDTYAQKAPLTEADYAAAKEIRTRLERLMAAAEKLMNKVEDAFIDQKVFGKLSAKEKLEFVKLFRDVWSREKEFDSLKPSLEDIYKKIFESPIVIGPDPVDPTPLPEPRPEPGVDIEGAGFIIQEGNLFLLRFGDKVLWPNNLPARYMINKLEVKFAAQFIMRAMPVDDRTNELPRVDDRTNELPRVDEPTNELPRIVKYPEISFTYIHAPQLPDEPFAKPDELATPTKVIEENINNEERPSNLMNAF
ncbi:MAG: hypothetical protein CVV41_14850 [Candidatus Riflebacteria bacterium HGW-Riflebacteria-1]|jgi:hypothetical protein|nr:MAG: hypothetical protein CVV41_14850 [Candidatus Riflebacteria bacterium HGW-Riflebacteria-1]